MRGLLTAPARPLPAAPVGERRRHLAVDALPPGQPSGVTATLVKMECECSVAIAFGLVFDVVPGATPKKPASGLIAHRRPSGPMRSQAMSSPTVHTFQPGCDAGGTSMARLVLPHALGNAAAM